MKVSEFLATHNSHAIYDSAKLGQDFVNETESASEMTGWPEHSEQNARQDVERRGLGGFVTTHPCKVKLAYGYQVATHLASRLVPGYRCTKMGRGSAVREAMEAIRGAGL